jgi:hypothetical protein
MSKRKKSLRTVVSELEKAGFVPGRIEIHADGKIVICRSGTDDADSALDNELEAWSAKRG